MKRFFTPIVISLVLLVLSIFAARTNLIFLNYIMIGLVIGIIVFAHKFNPRYYPILLFSIGLSLLWQITLMGQWVVGTDGQGEIYCSINTLQNGWNPFTEDINQANSSFIVGILLPCISWSTHIPIEWVYKIIPPIALAGAVVYLYEAFAIQTSQLKGFYASIFFIIMPVFSLEIGQLAKSMFAELFLAIMIYATVVNWNKWLKTAIIIFAFTICMLSHYTVGLIAIFYLICIFGVRLISAKFKWEFFKQRALSVVQWLLILIVCLGGYCTYYSFAGGGFIMKTLVAVGNIYYTINQESTPYSTSIGNPADNQGPIHSGLSITNQPPIIRTGLSMDFMDVSFSGKLFRIIQMATQLLIIFGALWLLFNFKKYRFKFEFITGIGSAFLMIALCIIVPFFSSTINATRFYHMALFFLAPLIVLGVDFLMDKPN